MPHVVDGGGAADDRRPAPTETGRHQAVGRTGRHHTIAATVDDPVAVDGAAIARHHTVAAVAALDPPVPDRDDGRRAAPPRGARHRRRVVAVLVTAFCAVAALVVGTSTTREAGATIRVDFDVPVASTPPTNIGFTATTLNVDGGAVALNARDVAALRRLGAGAVRIHLRTRSDGSLTTGARGGADEVEAQRWLDAYCGMGAQLTVVVDLNRAVATDVLKQLRSTGCRVGRFVLGNEMDDNSQANVSPAEYVRRFREIATALRAVDPTLQIGGPAPAYFQGLEPELVRGLLDAPADERASFIDYHAYGAGRGEQASMSSSWQYAEQLDRLRRMINDPAVGAQVGEFNLNWAEDPRDNTPFQSVWVASALGTILSRGAVAFQYGDKTEASGLVADGQPKASYWGMAAFTGAGRFRPFGTTMVGSTTSEPTLRVFASRDEKNIVVVNTGDARQVSVQLAGFAGGRATVWHSESGEFRSGDPVPVGSRLGLQLPALSITTVVLDERG